MKIDFSKLDKEIVKKMAWDTIMEEKETVISTMDKDGFPASRIVDIMFQQEDGLFFLTCTVKPFYFELMKSEKIALTVMTKNFLQVRIKGYCKKVEDSMLKKIYEKNPSFQDLFPQNDSVKNMEVFKVYKGKGELFDLSDEFQKMQRARFSFGEMQVNNAGCVITDTCINCGKCEKACPFGAISKEEHYRINPIQCDECGICYQVCPVNAIRLPSGL